MLFRELKTDRGRLETTSTSITRLKRDVGDILIRFKDISKTWNDKYLDYEIETCQTAL